MDGQVVLALPGHLQSGLLQGQNHALAVHDPLSLYKRRQIGMNTFPALPEPEAFIGPLRRSVKLCGPVWIVGPGPPLRPVQRVSERRVGSFPARGRHVQRLAGGQLHPRRHEMQFHPPALGVLMAHPRDVVLLRVHARKGQTLESVHGLLLLDLGGRILQGEGQNTVGVAPLAVDAVDQLAGLVHVAPHHLGRCMAAPLAVRGGQIGRNLSSAAAAPARELNQHRRAAHALPARRTVLGRSRSAAPATPQPAQAAGGSRHGPTG